jgi:hypothetical protein
VLSPAENLLTYKALTNLADDEWLAGFYGSCYFTNLGKTCFVDP